MPDQLHGKILDEGMIRMKMKAAPDENNNFDTHTESKQTNAARKIQIFASTLLTKESF